MSSYPVGYPQWAAWHNATERYHIFKRFGTLRSRIILHRQHELAMLEEGLKRLDKRDDQTGGLKIRSIAYDEREPDSERLQLIDRIDEKMKQYGRF